MRVLVGLGNPGQKYEHTRHNAGFRVLDEIGRRNRIRIVKREMESLCGEGSIGGEHVYLCKPQTFMNLSGTAVRDIVHRLRIDPEDLVVVLDDVNLEFGMVRVRPAGGDGGHKGLISVIEELGDSSFPRVRVGVGERPEEDDLTEFVLRALTDDERRTMDDAVEQAACACEVLVTRGIEEAMNRFNRRMTSEQ